jgi:Zn-finger nucleic acid-binding protein
METGDRSQVNCNNCGAAMELVESRRYFRCRHCGSYHFPETDEGDGIRVIGQSADALRCPVCADGLSHAVIDERHAIDFCVRCRGLLIPRATFVHVTARRRAWATTPPIDQPPLNQEELRRVLSCPKCGGRFETYPNYGPGVVVIDNCTGCDLIWLDFGEMRQIVDAPGRDRGTRQGPRVDEEVARQAFATSPDDEADDRLTRRRPAADPLGFLLDVIFDD